MLLSSRSELARTPSAPKTNLAAFLEDERAVALGAVELVVLGRVVRVADGLEQVVDVQRQRGARVGFGEFGDEIILRCGGALARALGAVAAGFAAAAGVRIGSGETIRESIVKQGRVGHFVCDF